VSPLLAVGLVALGVSGGRDQPGRWWRRSVLVPGTAVLVLGPLFGTLCMGYDSTRCKTVTRCYASALLAEDSRDLEVRLGQESGRNILVAELNGVGELRYLLDDWSLYFGRHNRIWLTNLHMTAPLPLGTPVETIEGIDALTDLRALPADCLFLTRSDSIFLRPAEGFAGHHVEWTAGVHTLWAPQGQDWAVIASVRMPLVGPDPRGSVLWLGGMEQAEVVVLAGRDGTVQLQGDCHLGPSLPERSERTVEVANQEMEFLKRFVVNQGKQALSVPVRKGVNRITLRVLDTPSVSQLVNGDKRPLMLAIRSLSVSLAHDRVGTAPGRRSSSARGAIDSALALEESRQCCRGQ
jgi:hypothetical protein